VSDTLQLIGSCYHYKTVTSDIQNCSHVFKRSSLCEGWHVFYYSICSLIVTVRQGCALVYSIITFHYRTTYNETKPQCWFLFYGQQKNCSWNVPLS